jgi:hypothetical protein
LIKVALIIFPRVPRQPALKIKKRDEAVDIARKGRGGATERQSARRNRATGHADNSALKSRRYRKSKPAAALGSGHKKTKAGELWLKVGARGAQ